MNRLRTRLRASIASGPFVLLDFISGGLDSRITFTRSSTATFVGSNGLIQTAAVNAPRFDYDPVTLAAKGLLIEEQRTNITLHSGVTAANWTAIGGTLANTGKLSPDGAANMGRFTEDTASTAHQMFTTASPGLIPAATTYTASLYLAAGTRRYVVVHGGANVNGWGVTVDTTNWTITGTYSVGLGSYISSTITNAGNGIYRVTLSGQVSTAVAQAYVVVSGSLVASATAPNTTYLGDGSTFFAWGAQLEAGTFTTSYIPTVASTVTRSADVATMTGTDFSSWFNTTQGTFVTSADAIATGVNRILVGGGALGYPSYIRTTQTGAVFDTANVVASTNVITEAPFKLATTYESGALNACLNGAAVATGIYNGNFASLTSISLGNSGTSTLFLNGHIQQIAYYNTRLSDAQLQALTAPSLAITLNLDFINGTYDA